MRLDWLKKNKKLFQTKPKSGDRGEMRGYLSVGIAFYANELETAWADGVPKATVFSGPTVGCRRLGRHRWFLPLTTGSNRVNRAGGLGGCLTSLCALSAVVLRLGVHAWCGEVVMTVRQFRDSVAAPLTTFSCVFRGDLFSCMFYKLFFFPLRV